MDEVEDRRYVVEGFADCGSSRVGRRRANEFREWSRRAQYVVLSPS